MSAPRQQTRRPTPGDVMPVIPPAPRREPRANPTSFPRESSFPRQTSSELLAAFDLIGRRGAGSQSWAAPLSDDPLAFLLDTMSDAINLWTTEGVLLYRNRASELLGSLSASPPSGQNGVIEELSLGAARYERRSLRCELLGHLYVLEVIRAVPIARN